MGLFTKIKNITKSLKNFVEARSRTKVFVGGVPWAHASKVESDLGADQKTYKKIFKYEPFVRGPVGATVDACIKSGWSFVPRFPETEVPEGMFKTIKHFFHHPEVQFPVFLRNLITNLIVYDDVYIECAKDDGAKGLYVLDSDVMTIKRDEHGTITDFISREGQGDAQVIFDPKQIVYVTMNRMGSAFYGLSDLETIVQPATLYRSAANYNKNLFGNKGIPTLAYLVKDASKDQMKEIEKKLKKIRVGDNILLAGDVKVQPISGTNKDLEYMELFNVTRREMMAVMRIPSIAVGYEGKTSLEGARVQLSTWGFRINGIQQVVENAIDRVILRLFGDNYVDVRFELFEWCDPYIQSQIDATESKWGIVTPNEIRARKGMKPRTGGDVPYVPVQTFPGRRPETVGDDGARRDGSRTEEQSERENRDSETGGKPASPKGT